MSTLSTMKWECKGILEVLKSGSLAVPRNQRSYAWEKDEVEELFKDLNTAIQAGELEYFLGCIVTFEENGKAYVVDGQQRLATTTILVAAIRDYFKSYKDQRGDQIALDFLVERDYRTQVERPKLELGKSDNDFFSRHILKDYQSEERNISPSCQSQRLLQAAAKLAAAFVKRQVADQASGGDALLHLVNWLEFLTRKAIVLWIKVPDPSGAFKIFETLNDRGRDLAPTDLLKNFLYDEAGPRIDEVEDRWMKMTAILEAQGSQARTVEYIKYLWASRYGAVREKELYKIMRDRITGSQSAVDVSDNLYKGAPLYVSICAPSQERWHQYGTRAPQDMALINLFGMTMMRPLILAILEHFKVSDVQKSLRLLVNWAVRFMICGGHSGTAIEKAYSEAAIAIRGGTITSASQLVKGMNGKIPSDKAFREQFAIASSAKPYIARYYLGMLESQRSGEEAFVPNSDETKFDLEHVLPQKPSKEWRVDAQTVDDYSSRIGNLALTKKADNSDLGNQVFSVKKALLAESDFALTKIVSENDDWGPKEIDARQVVLAELAVAAWPNKVT